MLTVCFLIVALIAQDCTSQDDEGPYRGKLIGKLNSYHHQVSGDVYAVDDWTLLLVDFNYDGTGDDAFFWAGDAGRPGPQGFIVPDQHGKTNVLERYYNEEVRLSLPEGKRVSRIKWLAVYDIASQNTFGDVYIPDEFESPAPLKLAPFSAAPVVSSLPLKILDANTILIPEFRYDGSGSEAYFWAGVGPQPSSRGTKLPDDYGYFEPLRVYAGEDVQLRLPGGLSVFQLDWLAVWDAGAGTALASVLLPDSPNVPPADTKLHPFKSTLPQCRQLHRDYQAAWEVFGNQITIQLTGLIGPDEYMSFGISGASDGLQMLGADVAVARFDPATQRATATDYNITAIAPCVKVLGVWRGVCPDSLLGGQDSNQPFSGTRDQGLTSVTYRRTLQPVEEMDREWATDRAVQAVWAVGPLDAAARPAFHRLHPRAALPLRIAADPPLNDCFPFTIGSQSAPTPWEVAELFDPALRVFHFRIGPSGGRRGVAGRNRGAGAAPALAWFVNGQLAPDIQLRRGLLYSFKVWGGNDPHSATEYHPLVVTTAPLWPAGGAVLAGAHTTRRGQLTPTAAGALCIGRHAAGADRRRDDDYGTFRAYNRSLQWACADGGPADLSVAPNASWPDIVYYNSFTHAGMGGRIFVVDRHRRNIAKQAAAAASLVSLTPLATVSLALAAVMAASVRW